MSLNPAVFLDRDGTIVFDPGYLDHPSKVQLLPRAGEAIRLLNLSGLKVVVVTNQSGLARGYFTEETLSAIHRRMLDLLEREGARLDGIYYCPHHIDGVIGKWKVQCGCRKPQPGLLFRAAEEMRLDLARSYVVGDKPSDIGAGRAAGCKTVLISSTEGTCEPRPDRVASDLYEAVSWILGDLGRE